MLRLWSFNRTSGVGTEDSCPGQLFTRIPTFPSFLHCGIRDFAVAVVWLLNRVWLFVTLWAVIHQAPLSMGFPRQECWSGLPFPSPINDSAFMKFYPLVTSLGEIDTRIILIVLLREGIALFWSLLGEKTNSQPSRTKRKQNRPHKKHVARVDPGSAAWASKLPLCTSSMLMQAISGLPVRKGLTLHSVILLLGIYHPGR